MTKGLLERLAEGPVLGDGGYLLELEKRGYVPSEERQWRVDYGKPMSAYEQHQHTGLSN